MPDGRRRGRINPEEVDRIWQLSLGTALGPFRFMDRIGLDVVLAVEEHHATIRDGIPTVPRELLRDYVDKGSSRTGPCTSARTANPASPAPRPTAAT